MTDFMTRLLVDSDPKSGGISLKAYWVSTATDAAGNLFLGELREGVDSFYQSILQANQSFIERPDFQEIVNQFCLEPFTAILNILESLKEEKASRHQEDLKKLEDSILSFASPLPQEPS